MTKKFWADWQKRIGETKNIYTFYYTFEGQPRNGYKHGILNNGKDRLIKATFHNDAVDLVIETKSEVFGKNGNHIHVENKYFTLHRNEIASIEFIEYGH